ncbi:MAG: type II secretion system protein, partial [Thermodesulfobacteriota bacterium]|nr:type II secretion system protein [Thermodesulfobacteriota bacterium]
MFKKSKGKRQAGFTLVEIAIVLVIIGLLIGGVLRGQSMIQSARVKRVAKQADEIRAAVMTFFDQYGQFPGDEDLNNIPPNDTQTGDGDGQIEGNGEHFALFEDLMRAGLISGSFNGTSDLPRHPFGDVAYV